MNQSRITLKKGKEEAVKRFHPWIFSGAISDIKGEPKEGDIVSVYSYNGEFLASGHYQIGSISVRVLSFESEVLLPNFWEEKIKTAYDMRTKINLAGDSNNQTNCYRLIHGEGDGLPGLIVDYYDGVAVMQAHSVGMFKSRIPISNALKKVYGSSLKAIYDKSSSTAPFKAGLDLQDGYLWKDDSLSNNNCSTVLENGHKFIVDWQEGQKTGFFLDQRENRALVGKYAKGKKVLNLFCYTGGFSIYALANSALLVDSVDSSAKAMEMVEKNIEVNNLDKSKHNSYCCDAIEFLKNSPDDKYDLIIVDPPAFAKHRESLSNALRAYQRLNAAAISKVSKGGLIFTFSCSQVVDKNAFALAVFSAAASTGRAVRILDRMNQPADHCVNIYHPEGEYLKGLFIYVE